MTGQKHTKEKKERDALMLANNVPLRVVACVNALAGIDDPEAFMRDVHRRFSIDWILNKHLKGGAE